jgi:hypothetical protein
VDLRRIGAEDAKQACALAQLGERLAHDGVEGVSGEDRVEAVAPRRLGDGTGDELEEIDLVPRERLDRSVERAGLVIRDEREGGAPRLAVHVEAHVRGHGDEARERLRVISDVRGDHRQPVQSRRTLARDGDLGRVAALRDVGRGIGRRGRCDCRRPGHGREQPAALVERDRVRVDGSDPVERDLGRADEEVSDGQDRLAGDRERRVVEQVVCLRNRTDERALDRQDADVDRARGRRLGHGGEARKGDELGDVLEEALAGCGAVSAVSAGVADDGSCGCGIGHRAFPKGRRSPPLIVS